MRAKLVILFLTSKNLHNFALNKGQLEAWLFF